MTGITLFASGRDFDVDSFLESSPWNNHVSVERKGDKSKSKRLPNLEFSGLQLQIASDEIDIDLQIEETIDFLEKNADELLRLKDFPEIEEIELRAGGYWTRDTAVFMHSFPAKLIALAAKYNMEISACVYAVSDE